MCRTTESGPGYFLCFEDCTDVCVCRVCGNQGPLVHSQKHNRTADARTPPADHPGGRRSPLRRPQSTPADADSFCVFTVRKKTASFVRWIRCGVWGSLALINSSRTIFSPTYWTPLYFSHSVANVFAHCIPFKKQRSRAPFFQDVIQKRLPQESDNSRLPAEKTTYCGRGFATVSCAAHYVSAVSAVFQRPNG